MLAEICVHGIRLNTKNGPLWFAGFNIWGAPFYSHFPVQQFNNRDDAELFNEDHRNVNGYAAGEVVQLPEYQWGYDHDR